MSAFGFLVFQDLRKFKNSILEIKKKPWKLLLYLLYLSWIGIVLHAAFGADDPIREVPNLAFKKDLFSILVNGLVFLFFIFSLYSGSKKFDGLFSMGDANFLFPSPISSRSVLAYSMLKQSLIVGLSGIFMAFFFPLLASIYGPMDNGSVVYSIVGIIVLLVFTVPFSYLSFILSSRFGMRQWLMYFLYGLTLFILGGIGYGIYMHGDLLQGLLWALNHPLFRYTPIVGWSAELIGVSVLGKSSFTDMALILQFLTIGLATFGAIYLGMDYYEDALSSTEKRFVLVRNKNQGQRIDWGGFSKKKTRQVDVRKVGEGPWAFLWMQLVSNKRSSGSLIFQWKTLGLLIASTVVSLLMPNKSLTAFYFTSGIIAYITFLASMHMSIHYELKMKYIFILPGAPWKKLVALNMIPMLKGALLMGSILLPTGFIFGVPLLSIASGLIFPLSMAFLNVFNAVIAAIFIPNGFDRKAFTPLISMASFILLLIPPGIVGLMLWEHTQSIPLAFATVAGINFFLSLVLLWLSHMLFDRLELR